MSFKLSTGFTHINNNFIDKYMVLSPVYSMVYIYSIRLASEGISAENKDIADKLNIFESDVLKAWKFWEEKGIVKINNNEIEFLNFEDTVSITYKKAETVFYNPSDVKMLAKEDKNIDQLILTVEKIMGKTLSTNNINIVMNMYDHLRLPYEVIITLVQYYSDKSLSYVEKVAISWSERGITTIEAAEAELNSYSIYNKIIKFFGITGRSYTENEKKYMIKWINEYKMPLEVIKIACERAVENTGKASLSYANKILANWCKNGVKNISDIQRLDEKSIAAKNTAKTVKNVFTNYDQKIYTEEEIKEILRRKANN